MGHITLLLSSRKDYPGCLICCQHLRRRFYPEKERSIEEVRVADICQFYGIGRDQRGNFLSTSNGLRLVGFYTAEQRDMGRKNRGRVFLGKLGDKLGEIP